MFNTSTICILISVVVYLLGMLAIGIMYSKNSTTEDFYLGGRKLGPIVTAMSTEASDMSAYLLMGVPGLAFFCGVAEAGWTAIGLARYISQLAHRRQANETVFRKDPFHHRA